MIRTYEPFENTMNRARATSSERNRSTSRSGSRGGYGDTYRSSVSPGRIRSSEGERRSVSPTKRLSPHSIPHRPLSTLSPSYSGGRRKKKKQNNSNEKEREELNQLLLHERMNVNALEQTITLLRAEHVKKDRKLYKQEKKIENLVDIQSSTRHSPYSIEVRKEIEHDSVINKFKFQLKELRQALAEKEMKIKSLIGKNVDDDDYDYVNDAMINDYPKKSKKKDHRKEDLHLIEQLKKEIDDLTSKNDHDINQMKKDLSDMLSQRDKDIHDKDEVISKQDKTISQIKMELADITTDRDLAIKEKDLLIHALSDAKKDRDEAILKKKVSDDQIQSMNIQISQLNHDKLVLEKEIDELQAKYEEQSKEHEEQSKKYEEQSKKYEELAQDKVKKKIAPKNNKKNKLEDEEVTDQMQSMNIEKKVVSKKVQSKNEDDNGNQVKKSMKKKLQQDGSTEDGSTDDTDSVKSNKKAQRKNTISVTDITTMQGDAPLELDPVTMASLIEKLNTDLINQLNEEKNSLSLTLTQMNIQISQLNQEKISLQSELEKALSENVEIENEKKTILLDKNSEIKKLQEALKSLYETTKLHEAKKPDLEKALAENKVLQNKILAMEDASKKSSGDGKSKEIQIQVDALQKELNGKDTEYKKLLKSVETLQQQLDDKKKAFDVLVAEKTKSDDLLGKMVALNQALTQKNKELVQNAK